MISTFTIKSDFDDLTLCGAYCKPEAGASCVLQIAHGMAEHKERYFPFMEYLAARGIASVIHDHRGHGASVKSPDDLGFMYAGGWNAMVEDVKKVQDWAKDRFPGLPVILMGHSMGSMVVRAFTKRYDSAIDGLIVCGCPSNNPAKGAGKVLASLVAAIRGDHFRSKLLDSMSFGSFNKPFEAEGELAWLSANRENVRSYIADPLCGFCFTANGFMNLMGVMMYCYSPKGWALANPSLRVMFISGGDDPCRIDDKAFGKAVQFMKDRGYSNVSSKLYPGLRHELLLEKSAEVIFDDIVRFISSRS